MFRTHIGFNGYFNVFYKCKNQSITYYMTCPRLQEKSTFFPALNAILIFGIYLFASPTLGMRLHCYNYTNMGCVCVHTDMYMKPLSQKQRQFTPQEKADARAICCVSSLSPSLCWVVQWGSDSTCTWGGHNSGENPQSKQLRSCMRLLVTV